MEFENGDANNYFDRHRYWTKILREKKEIRENERPKIHNIAKGCIIVYRPYLFKDKTKTNKITAKSWLSQNADSDTKTLCLT